MLQMVCVTDVLYSTLIDGGEALAGGLSWKEGLGLGNNIAAGLWM